MVDLGFKARNLNKVLKRSGELLFRGHVFIRGGNTIKVKFTDNVIVM